MARPAPPPEGRRLRPGRVLSDHLLLRWCQQSATGETWVASPVSLAIAPALASDLTRSAIALDALLRRLADGLLAHDPALADLVLPTFPSPRTSMRAARSARRFSGGASTSSSGPTAGSPRSNTTATSRPGSGRSGPRKRSAPGRDNPNRGARARFRRALATAWRRHAEAHVGAHVSPSSATPPTARSSGSRICSAREARALGWEWEVVDPHTLTVEDGHRHRLRAPRGRRAPSLPDRVSPRAARGRARFSRAASSGSTIRAPWWPRPRAASPRSGRSFETDAGSRARRPRWSSASCPPSGLASQIGWLDRARTRPEDWVLKPVLGRYSERVDAGSPRLHRGMAGRADHRRREPGRLDRPGLRAAAQTLAALADRRPSGLRQLGCLSRRRQVRRPVPALPAHTTHRRRPRMVGAACSAPRACRWDPRCSSPRATRVVTTWVRHGGRSPTARRSAATRIAGPTASPTSASRRSRSRPAHGTSCATPPSWWVRPWGGYLRIFATVPSCWGSSASPSRSPRSAPRRRGRRTGAFSRASTGRGRPRDAGSSSRSTATLRPDSGRRARSRARWRSCIRARRRLRAASLPRSPRAGSAGWSDAWAPGPPPEGSRSDSSGRSAPPRTRTSFEPMRERPERPCPTRTSAWPRRRIWCSPGSAESCRPAARRPVPVLPAPVAGRASVGAPA